MNGLTLRPDPHPARRSEVVSAPHVMRAGSLAAGLVVVLILVSQALRPVYAFRPPAGAPEPTFKAYLDRSAPLVLRHYDVPGMVISTVIRGAPARTYAYGFADRERRKPMTTDTVFRVASISKSLTAWGVLRLVQEGKVDIDAPIQRYLSHWPLPKSKFSTLGVTTRRLLNHTAGLNAGADQFRRPDEPAKSPLEMLAREGDGPAVGPATLVSQPGAAYRYSVPGYTLLRLLLEEQSHQNFQDYMKAQVLLPLGMTSSSFDWDGPLHSRTATPYQANGRPMPVLIPEDVAADSLFSTGPDLARFVAAPLPDDKLPAGAYVLTTQSVERFYASADRMPGIQLEGLKLDGPGLGCFIEQLPNGGVIITNGGYDPGWASQFYIVPGTGDGIVVLTNSEAGEPAIAEILADWAAWRGLPPMKMTRAHYVLRMNVALVLGIMVMISLYFGSNVIVEVGSGARRLGALTLAALAGSVFETTLVLGLMALWILLRVPIVTSMPIFYDFGAFAISLCALVAMARLVFPRVPVLGNASASSFEPVAPAPGKRPGALAGATIAP